MLKDKPMSSERGADEIETHENASVAVFQKKKKKNLTAVPL